MSDLGTILVRLKLAQNGVDHNSFDPCVCYLYMLGPIYGHTRIIISVSPLLSVYTDREISKLAKIWQTGRTYSDTKEVLWLGVRKAKTSRTLPGSPHFTHWHYIASIFHTSHPCYTILHHITFIWRHITSTTPSLIYCSSYVVHVVCRYKKKKTTKIMYTRDILKLQHFCIWFNCIVNIFLQL